MKKALTFRRTSRVREAVLAFSLLSMLVPLSSFAQTTRDAPSTETITVNAVGPSHPFPHFWEQMFGSGRAILSLRADYRRDLREVKAATGFQYIRFHGIFLDDAGVYGENFKGQPVYNFTYVDQIYDGLLKNGVRPYVELSFMPKDLASTPERQAFWYKPYISPPRNWNLWGDLIEHFVRHLVARYGIEEVRQWYFEVWNEPNISFWAGVPKQATYFKLYDVSARAIKSVDPQLRVGGPATAQAAWVSPFIKHCVVDKVPVDFISTHVYGDDTDQNVFGKKKFIPRREMVALAVNKVHDEVKTSVMPNLPIIFSEFNASYMNQVDVTDSPFLGPWLADTIRQCDGVVDSLAYWTFSDVFEEQGVPKRPFYGGFGLIAVGGIPKASLNAFRLLHRLGTERLQVDSDSALATRRADGSLAIAVWNYAPAGKSGATRHITLSIAGLAGAHVASITGVDRNYGSPLDAWENMGRPAFPTQQQQEELRRAGQLPAPEIRALPAGKPAELSITLPAHSLALVEITKKND